MDRQIVCEHPRIILNPSLCELLARYGHYVLSDGRMYRYTARRSALYHVDYRLFSVSKYKITHDDIDKCFVVDTRTGNLFPIYLEVPCGKCALCKNTKIASFVERCKLESMCYVYRPWFINLTYDEDHVPVDGVSVRDAQLFLKRLRINLERAGYQSRIRYVLVGEYGKNTRRPHYHCLVWNIPTCTHKDFVDVSRIILKSWTFGFVSHRLVDPSNNKSFYYTSKYLRKDSPRPYYKVREYVYHDPNGVQPDAPCCEIARKNKFFMNSSRRNGGIGAHFLRDHVLHQIHKNLNPEFRFLNVYTNTSEKLHFNRYILDRLFPSWSRLVPSKFRKAVYQYLFDVSAFTIYENDSFFVDRLRRYQSVLSDWLPVGSDVVSLNQLPKSYQYDRKTCVRRLFELEPLIDHGIATIDFQAARASDDLRHLFISKLDQLPRKNIDIAARSYEIKRSFALAAAREQF